MLLSGGIDSATLLYGLLSHRNDVFAVTINYGQKHVREIQAAIAIAAEAKKTSKYLKNHTVIDLSVLQPLLQSSLTKKGDVIPEGHYEAASMKSTVVPNRNAIMLNIIAGYAISINADRIAYAAHAGDHAIYPDCRPRFVEAIQSSIQIGTDTELEVYAPFIYLHKSDIVKLGLTLHVPFYLTWSCYKGQQLACGRCGTCVERLEAFAKNRAIDPIEYESEHSHT